MDDSITFDVGSYGVKAIIKTRWDDSYLQILLDHKVQELELNLGKGWRGDNVDFLQYLPELKSLIILDLRLDAINAIHSLHKLVKLELSTYSKIPINFSSFPELTTCGFEWIKGSDSLFERTNLKALGINRYSGKSSQVFSKLINLEKLTVLNSPINDFQGLATLNKLKYLSLANLSKLSSLEGIGNLEQLEELRIHTCKRISSVSEVFELKNLKKFYLLNSGNIESIRGIENLTELIDFIFYESTNITDGDLTPLLKLKNLSNISYQNRRHYTHKREEFGEAYGGTN